MKLQGLAVIFVLIILPISIVLSEYVQVQIDTLSVQTAYDSQLLSATYDAVVAFQKNTVNSWSSTITSSKIRDIEASANVFLTSIANNFKMSGNSKDAIKEYIPAIVYTLYDGYYIYSPFTNKIEGVVDSETYNGSYGIEERTFGLKPYIYYSREYENCPSQGDSFVITYSLDNYITIQGKVNGNIVNEGGYIIDITELPSDNYDGSKYKGVDIIGNEVYKEYVDKDTEYPCAKVNGTKYYLDKDGNDIDGIFYFVQSDRNYLTEDSANVINKYFENKNSAKEYYMNAYNFTKKVLGDGQDDFNLSGLKSSNAKDWNVYIDKSKKTDGEQGIKDTQADYDIFTNDKVEYYNSGFNQERRAVIKYAIEKNLAASIANFNNISENTKTNFQMPKLSDDEWDKAINNVSVITFLQGINMGNRPYNGYAIVPNNKNEESVGEDSIYIVADGEYHRVNDNDLLNKNSDKISIGVFNMNFERKAIDKFDGDGSTIERTYFYPRHEMACYNSIVSQTGVTPLNDNDGIPITIYKYLDDIQEKYPQIGPKIASVYYTALGRERNGLVKYGLKESTEEYIQGQQNGGGNDPDSENNITPVDPPDGWGDGLEDNNDLEDTESAYAKLKVGDSVIYTTKSGQEIPCKVLYDVNSGYGVQIITEDVIGNNVSFGKKYNQNQTSTEAYNTAIGSYNSAIDTLNNAVSPFLNDEIATMSRSVGTNPENGEEGNNTSEGNLDYIQMQNSNCLNTSSMSNYWMGARKNQTYRSNNNGYSYNSYSLTTYYNKICYINVSTSTLEECIIAVQSHYRRQNTSSSVSSTSYTRNNGVRGVFTLKENIIIKNKNGKDYIEAGS